MSALPRRAAYVCAALLTSSLSFAQSNDSAPVCINGGPYFAECNGGATNVAVDGTASFDPEQTPLTFFWFEECPFGFFEDPTDPLTNYVIDMTGVCTRACVFALRVTSGGQTTACQGTARVDDTTAPSLILPGDFQGVWGTDTSPATTGTATAVDLCDPAPLVTYFDTIIPQQGPGVEQTIIRTWHAIDYCFFMTMEDQVITLLSPAGNAHNLEVDVNNCVDVIDRAALPPRFFLTLLGRSGTPVTSLNPTTLRLSTMADGASSVAPTQWFAPQDVGFLAAAAFGDCNPPGQDGMSDLKLRFDVNQVLTTLGLDTVSPGTNVPLMITGQRWNGSSYMAVGELVVQ
jgi:hypothetical protein